MTLAVLIGGGFALTSLLNQRRFALSPAMRISLHVDAWIPFLPEWVWIYLLYYPFCFLPLALREIRDDPDAFVRTVWAFSLQFGFSYLCFVVLPTQIKHPALSHGAASEVLRKIYRADNGFNSFPSLHVANVTFVALLFERLRGTRAALPLAIVAMLIAASTVLVKQHYIADVILGAVLGWSTFTLAFRGRKRCFAAPSHEKNMTEALSCAFPDLLVKKSGS